MPIAARTLPALLLAFALAGPAVAEVADTPMERALYLTRANFRVVFPRGDWSITREQGRSDGRAVYYALSSAQRDLTMWLFIDQTPVCQSATACLELAMKNQAYASAKDMRFSDQEPFKVVRFTVDGAQGGERTRHVIAAGYVDGCWLDVHLIQAEKPGTNADAMLEFLKLVSVK
jgi:hypothetical protein